MSSSISNRAVELIDTLWNVNDDFVQNTFYLGEPELIDTLWNVNTITTAYFS